MRLLTQALVRVGFGAAFAYAASGCTAETVAPVAPPLSQAGTSATGLGNLPTAGSHSAPAGSYAPAVTAGAGALPPGDVQVGGSGAAGGGAVAAGSVLPCDVSKVLAKNCGSCHGAEPIGGAPMPLTKYDDLMVNAKTNPAMRVADVTKLRLNDTARPMPPGATITPEDKAMLNGWLDSGMPGGTAADVSCGDIQGPVNTEYPGLTPLPGETCYDLAVHNSHTEVDAAPMPIEQGEHYYSFYYKAPWPDGSVATRYGSKLDNVKVLHHWLLFKTIEDKTEGDYTWTPLPTLVGVQAELLAGWAVGGVDMTMPDGVGFELPPKGTQLNVQWHFYNFDTTPQTDHSSMQICVVPGAARPNHASITWVGTEDIGGNRWTFGAGMPAHQESTFQGTCNPLREGMNATDPIHVVGYWPHMHQLGTRMETYINRKDGTKEKVFDKPFDFNHQIHYMQDDVLNPGETLQAVCHYNNTTNAGVPFGESSDTEMCYQFVISYPAGALQNHVLSLIGATNTCW